ncbi:MAG: hypothetical protein LLG04_17435 [Parachlamydia sp.]|nr:hypothetical protein [Parachlamydia sp.]
MPSKETIVSHAVKIEHLDQLPNQLLSLLTPYRVILIGEIHGTKELPAFCLGILKMLAVDKNTPVILALEISEAEQPIFDEFMGTGNSQVFEKSSLFTDKQQYGISSEAMVQLLTSLRKIDNVRVLCSLSKDSPSKASFQENQEERDFKWAAFILKQLCSKETPRVVVMGGSIHLSLIPYMLGNVPLKTMGYYLLHSKECPLTQAQVLAIDIKFKDVNAWVCFSDTCENMDAPPATRCGEMSHSIPENNYSTALNWDSYFLMETSEGHNTTLFIRKLSASKPFIP